MIPSMHGRNYTDSTYVTQSGPNVAAKKMIAVEIYLCFCTVFATGLNSSDQHIGLGGLGQSNYT